MKLVFGFILLISFLDLSAQTETGYEKFADSVFLHANSANIISILDTKIKSRPNDGTLLRISGFLAIEFDKLNEAEKYLNKSLKIDPDAPRTYYNLARLYALKNNGKKALEFADKSIELNPDDGLLYENRAKIKWMLEDLNGAMQDIDVALLLEPKNVNYYMVKSDLNLFKKMHFLALKEINKALKVTDTLAVLYYKRSAIYSEENQLKEAMDDINKAIALEPGNLKYRSLRAEIFFKFNEFQAAIDDYSYINAENPEDASVYYYRAYCYFKLEQMDQFCTDVHICYQKIQGDDSKSSLKNELEQNMRAYCDTNNASYYYQRGVAFYNLEHYKDAVAIYSKGIQKFPENAMLYSFRANAEMALNSYQNAINDYEKSITKKDNLILDMRLNNLQQKMSKETEETFLKTFIATMLLSSAEARFAMKHTDEAILEANKAIEQATNILEFPLENYYFTRGNILLAAGKYHEALNDYEKCVELNPNFAEAYAYSALAKIYMDNGKALGFELNGTTLNQTKSLKWIFPSKYKINKNLINEALSDIEKSLELNPELAFSYYLRGILKKYRAIADYCEDIKKAQQLSYAVEPMYLKACK